LVEISEGEEVVRDEQVNSFIEDLQEVHIFVNVGLELNQVEHEQETDVNVCKDLEGRVLWLVVIVSNVHKSNSAHQENKEVVEYSVCIRLEISVQNSVPHVILHLQAFGLELVSRLAVQQI
jgi:hypothetical protein